LHIDGAMDVIDFSRTLRAAAPFRRPQIATSAELGPFDYSGRQVEVLLVRVRDVEIWQLDHRGGL